MRTRTIVSTLTLALVLTSAVAMAGPRDVAIHVTRMGGDAATAQPYVDRFLRYVESALGWPAASMSGKFLPPAREAVAYMTDGKPGIGMMEPPLYFELRRSLNLQPILQIVSADLVTPRLHVVVKDPALTGLASLAGKRVCTTLGDAPQYLSRVVLDGQVDAATAWKLKGVRQPLKGVRGVLRGECDATTLDDDQLAKAREMTGGADLRSIYTSPALPAVPAVVIGDALPAADRDALVKVMLEMCGTEKGAPVCKEMHIERFAPLDAAVFDAATKKYGD